MGVFKKATRCPDGNLIGTVGNTRISDGNNEFTRKNIVSSPPKLGSDQRKRVILK